VGMAVNGSDAGEVIIFLQSESISPVNESFLDSLAFGVGADGAEAFVTLGIDGGARGGFAPDVSGLFILVLRWGRRVPRLTLTQEGAENY
jgi:hypothetical protein